MAFGLFGGVSLCEPASRQRPLNQLLARGRCQALRPSLAATAARRAVASSGANASGPPWQAVVDPASGKTYWWNTDTQATTWEVPHQQPAAEAAREAEPSAATPPGIGFEELEALLLATSAVYLSKVVEPHRDEAFSDAFTDYLTAKIAASSSAGDGEAASRLEKLRARLANPLIRQPPPFL